MQSGFCENDTSGRLNCVYYVCALCSGGLVVSYSTNPLEQPDRHLVEMLIDFSHKSLKNIFIVLFIYFHFIL